MVHCVSTFSGDV